MDDLTRSQLLELAGLARTQGLVQASGWILRAMAAEDRKRRVRRRRKVQARTLSGSVFYIEAERLRGQSD